VTAGAPDPTPFPTRRSSDLGQLPAPAPRGRGLHLVEPARRRPRQERRLAHRLSGGDALAAAAAEGLRHPPRTEVQRPRALRGGLRVSLGARLWAGLRPYLQKEPLAALALGMSSGFPYAMIGATLTTRLAQHGIDKKAVTAFSLAFLAYNLKVFWAPLVDGARLPLLGR